MHNLHKNTPETLFSEAKRYQTYGWSVIPLLGSLNLPTSNSLPSSGDVISIPTRNSVILKIGFSNRFWWSGYCLWAGITFGGSGL